MRAPCLIAAVLVALFCASAATAEPINTTGTIAAVEKERRRIRVASPEEGPVTIAITDETAFWIEAKGSKPRKGSFADCEVGRAAEVKYVDPWTRDTAEWVKLRP